MGVITPSSSEWQEAHRRFCVDYRGFNILARHYSHSMKRVDDMIEGKLSKPPISPLLIRQEDIGNTLNNGV